MIDKRIIKWIKIYVAGSLLVSAVAVGLWGYYIVSRAFQSQKLVDSQIEYQKALTESVGQPQTIIQEYRSPNK